MKIRPVGAELLPYGRTDMTKLTVAFRNFAKTSKNEGKIRRSVKTSFPLSAKNYSLPPKYGTETVVSGGMM